MRASFLRPPESRVERPTAIARCFVKAGSMDLRADGDRLRRPGFRSDNLASSGSSPPKNDVPHAVPESHPPALELGDGPVQRPLRVILGRVAERRLGGEW